MRLALALGPVLALAGCGDNAPTCGYVEALNAYRNIWPGQIAVDDERVYYSDYDNGAGTHLVFRQPREGGQPLVIAARGETDRFGYGMASDGQLLYWAAETQTIGYALFETPVLGGRSSERGVISPCTAQGIAHDALAVYAGAIRCEGVPARVIAYPHAGGTPRELWSSQVADVTGIAAVAGTVYIATSAGVVRVAPGGETELIDARPAYHVVVAGDDIVYSTEEEVIALPMPGGGAPRTLYRFTSAIGQPRAFGVDGTDLYVADPPALLFVPQRGVPQVIVRDVGAVVTHVVARDAAAYWSTFAVPGSIGLPGSFSGGVFRVERACDPRL